MFLAPVPLRKTLLGLLLPLGLAAAPGPRSPALDVPPERFVCVLTGAQGSPPNSSLATGNGEILLRGNRIRVRFAWRGLSGAPTGLHIHVLTAVGTDGPIAFNLIPGRAPEGAESPLEAQFEIDPVQRDLLREGRMYADLHTRIYPDGEIRGPIVRSLDGGPHGPAGPDKASYDFVATAGAGPGAAGAAADVGRRK